MGKIQYWNISSVNKQQASVLQHQGFVCLQTGCAVQWDFLRWHCPSLCPLSVLVGGAETAEDVSVPSCANVWFYTSINVLIDVLHCECKNLLAHIHSCHVCCGFRGCSQRETVAAGSQQEWEHSLQLNFAKKRCNRIGNVWVGIPGYLFNFPSLFLGDFKACVYCKNNFGVYFFMLGI